MSIENTLNAVELMQVGVKANGIEFTADDLQGIADAYRALGLDGKVPLKLGHNDQQPLTDGKPALGWARNLRVVADRLVADFVDVPKLIYDGFKTGRYKNVSVELLKNVQAGTRIIPWVVDAVALLGADQPAFGNLRDLQSLTMARGAVPKHEARATFSVALPPVDIDALRAEHAREIMKVRVDDAIESDIRAEEVLPTARDMFKRVFKGDEYTLTNWKEFARTQPKPNFRASRRAIAAVPGGDDDTTLAATVLSRLTDEHVEQQRAKFGRVVPWDQAAVVVLRANPALGSRWHQEQQQR